MSAKQAINDKLQGNVATYLRCGGVVNKQIQKGLLLGLWLIFLNGEYLAKLQARTWLSRTLSPSLAVFGPNAQVHETTTFLLVTL